MSRAHTFADLASEIDDAFARWDRAHLHQFWRADGRRVTTPTDWEDFADDDCQALEDRRVKLSALALGDEFVYEFDVGDGWAHDGESSPPADTKTEDLPAIGPWQWMR